MGAPVLLRCWLVALLCLSVLGVRVTGLHIHLCQDGQEQPAQAHWEDGGIHADEEHAGEEHADVDVPLDKGALKASWFSNLPVAMVHSGPAFALASADVTMPLAFAVAVRPGPRRFLRPLLRGPPL